LGAWVGGGESLITEVSFELLLLCAKWVTKVTFTHYGGAFSIHFVVWQFWGRAAEASLTEKSRALFIFPGAELARDHLMKRTICISST